MTASEKQMELIEAAVLRHALERPDHPALVTRYLMLDYGQLWRCAVRAAHWLGNHGVGPGARVAIRASDDPWFAAIYLGTHLAGAIAVPLVSRLPEQTARQMLASLEPQLDLGGQLLTDLKKLLASTAAQHAAVEDAPLPDPQGIADIMFTSGSSGHPKAVMLTHANVAATARHINAFIGNGADDREVVTVPLNHSFGLGRLRCNLLAGGTLVLVPGLSFPALIYKALIEHRATGLSAVPAGIAVLLKGGSEHFAASTTTLRYVELGSSRMEGAQKQLLMQLLPQARLCMHYGLTEASRSAFIEFHHDALRLHSVGRAAPDVQIQIADAAGKPLRTGETGRIRVRGPGVMQGYWRDRERTRRAIDTEGWLDTGDLGSLDEDGYLYLAGRGDDLINVGGRNVYPPEVEDTVIQHPGVLECACVAAPDADGLLGEVPVLYVVACTDPPPDAATLCRLVTNGVGLHAAPRIVRYVTGIPKTESGKPRRAVLRAQEANRPFSGELPPRR